MGHLGEYGREVRWGGIQEKGGGNRMEEKGGVNK